jgi:hypothetical protein
MRGQMDGLRISTHGLVGSIPTPRRTDGDRWLVVTKSEFVSAYAAELTRRYGARDPEARNMKRFRQTLDVDVFIPITPAMRLTWEMLGCTTRLTPARLRSLPAGDEPMNAL